jgi:hypothetical protein
LNEEIKQMSMKHRATCECAKCAGQSDADFALQTADNVRRFGRSVICVPEGDRPNEPAFGYTIGNWQAGYPELLVIGPSASVAAALLNLLSDEMIKQKRAFHDGELLRRGGNLPFKTIRCGREAREEYTCQATNAWGDDDYAVMQILLPDPKGHFPDNPRCVARYRVPVLSEKRGTIDNT